MKYEKIMKGSFTTDYFFKCSYNNFKKILPFMLKIEHNFDSGVNGRHKFERFLLSEDVKFSTALWILLN